MPYKPLRRNEKLFDRHVDLPIVLVLVIESLALSLPLRPSFSLYEVSLPLVAASPRGTTVAQFAYPLRGFFRILQRSTLRHADSPALRFLDCGSAAVLTITIVQPV